MKPYFDTSHLAWALHRFGAMGFAQATAPDLAKRGDVTMTQYGTWVSYGGTARIVLAVILLAAAGGVVYAGTRLPLPVRAARPGEGARTFMLVTWGLAVVAFLVCLPIYVHQARREHLFHTAPADPILPVTATCVAVIFFIILLASRPHGWRVMVTSAAIGAMAAPMIFELPFDLIVMARTYPPIPPDPALYRVLFFAPLFLVEVATLSLLTLSPMLKLRKATFFSFALMLAVFAAWALAGFAYPSAPVPFALNVLSKVLAFITALSLFIPQRTPASAPKPSRKMASSGTPPRAGCGSTRTASTAMMTAGSARWTMRLAGADLCLLTSRPLTVGAPSSAQPQDIEDGVSQDIEDRCWWLPAWLRRFWAGWP